MAVDQARLHRALNPQTVVVVGDKAPNFSWLENQREFTGDLYSVQLDEKEIVEIEKRGFTNFLKMSDVPADEIDLVICAVPRNVAPYILNDAVQNKVHGIHFFTAGFAETGEEDAIAIQAHMVDTANEHGMVVIGPNCMGIYNRRLGVKFAADVEQGEGGNVSIIAQSGTHAINLTQLAQLAGLKVTRAISMGNAVVTNECDLLEYLMNDPDTDVIGMYMEGMRDGRRFFPLLREATKKKPVVIWKGGRTAAGQRATRSHTASLATPSATWDALMTQTGAISTTSVDQTIDVLSALVHGGRPRGKNMALMAMTGGQSVAISDAFGSVGLDVPALSDRSYEQLGEFFNIIGGSYRNPFDMAGTIGMSGDSANLEKIMSIVAEDPAVENVVYEFSAGFFVRQWQEHPERLKEMLDTLDAFRERSGLPMVTVLHPYHQEEAVRPVRQELIDRGYAVYPSFERAANAFAKVIGYYRELDGA